MPTKRYHKKSRAGCDTCKRRRVKCDEATPICGTCAQRQDKCSYSQATFTNARARQSASTATPSSSASPVSTSISSFALFGACERSTSRLGQHAVTRMKEMQLMHQWSTETYLNSGPRSAEAFRDYIVAKALDHSFLMDILLAFTSLHSATKAEGPSDAYEHITTALHYQNQSIAELNNGQILARITQETFEPIILASFFNAVCTMMASLVPATSGEQLESIPEVMMRVRGCMVGLNEVLDQGRPWAEHGELTRIFRSPSVLNITDGGSITAEKVQKLIAAILANIELDDPATPFFRGALEKLEKTYVDCGGRSVFGWLSVIEAEFFQRVDIGESAAMVILACWGTLAYTIEGLWWTKYAGRRIVEDLSVRLNVCDCRWNEILQWCHERVGTSSNE